MRNHSSSNIEDVFISNLNSDELIFFMLEFQTLILSQENVNWWCIEWKGPIEAPN